MVVKCPNCGKLVEYENNPYRPFCSERCRLIDLGKWIEEEYRILGEVVDSSATPAQKENAEPEKKVEKS